MGDNETTVRQVPQGRWPLVDASQMREVDYRMENEFGIELMQMMENAGRSLAWLALHRFSPERVVVLAGAGGNGGGGLAAARHLANRGLAVEVALVVPTQELDPVPRRQLQTLEAMHIPVEEVPDGSRTSHLVYTDLVIDAMVGYSLSTASLARPIQRVYSPDTGSQGLCARSVREWAQVRPRCEAAGREMYGRAGPASGLRHANDSGAQHRSGCQSSDQSYGTTATGHIAS